MKIGSGGYNSLPFFPIRRNVDLENKIPKLEQPLNANERYLHSIAVRLDAIIHILSSLVEVYAHQNKMAVTSNEINDEVEASPPKRSRKKQG